MASAYSLPNFPRTGTSDEQGWERPARQQLGGDESADGPVGRGPMSTKTAEDWGTCFRLWVKLYPLRAALVRASL